MRIDTSSQSIESNSADAVVVGRFADESLAGSALAADTAMDGALTRLMEAEEISAKLGETTSILAPAGLQTNCLVVVGLGDREKWSRGGAFKAVGCAVKQLAGKERETLAFHFDDWSGEMIETGVCAALVASSGQDLYRRERKLHPPRGIAWPNADEAAVTAGRILGESVNLTRELVNEPASSIYPESFAARAESIAGQLGIDCEIWDEQRLETEGCGSLLGVARGSVRQPRLVVLRYRGGDKDKAPLALVGKGVTFDSGGLSLKSSDSMKTMKCDMAGAATVLGAVQAIARLKLPINVVGLMGLVENMVSGDSFKLGDVLTARSGKTIEVLNTDAEGRLVLADVLNVAADHKPSRIIDLATLTGACVVALGLDMAGLMSNNQPWCDEILAAAESCGELAWQLPMLPHFNEQIRSKVADIKNVGDGRWGGAITAAKFLEEFVDEGTPWTHIDIAGPAFLDSAKSHIDAGGSGAFVRTLVQVARRMT